MGSTRRPRPSRSAGSTSAAAIRAAGDLRPSSARSRRTSRSGRSSGRGSARSSTTERTGGRSGGRGVVAEGRDITTVVAPDADVRILLTASEEARLARRALEVHGVADAAAVAATRDHVVRRDAKDSTVVEFLTAADGVVTVDSSPLTLDETVEAVLAVVLREAGTQG